MKMLIALLMALVQPCFADGLVEDMWVVTSGQEKSGAALKKAVLWEDGVLPLTFARRFSGSQRAQVLDACAEWSAVANVRCIEGEYKGRTVHVNRWVDACWALWGMGSHFLVFKRRINLDDGCFTRATLLHELGHAFGLIHEHQRHDRDSYIEIRRENVAGGFLGINTRVNFGPQQMKFETPYDFLSIMHYSRRAYSKNGLDTMVPLPENAQYLDVIGRVGTISELDALAMRNAYGRAQSLSPPSMITE